MNESNFWVIKSLCASPRLSIYHETNGNALIKSADDASLYTVVDGRSLSADHPFYPKHKDYWRSFVYRHAAAAAAAASPVLAEIRRHIVATSAISIIFLQGGNETRTGLEMVSHHVWQLKWQNKLYFFKHAHGPDTTAKTLAGNWSMTSNGQILAWYAAHHGKLGRDATITFEPGAIDESFVDLIVVSLLALADVEEARRDETLFSTSLPRNHLLIA